MLDTLLPPMYFLNYFFLNLGTTMDYNMNSGDHFLNDSGQVESSTLSTSCDMSSELAMNPEEGGVRILIPLLHPGTHALVELQ